MATLLLIASIALPTLTQATPENVFDHPLAPAAVRDLLSKPARELSQNSVLRGRFTQRKILKELPTPLTSNGDFVFARDLGISWHTRVPFDSEFLLTTKGVMQKDNGAVAMQLTTDQQPALQIALRLFVGLFSLDLDSLAVDFQLFATSVGGHWQLGLKPRNAAMSSVFSEALIDGSGTVESVELHDSNGDRTLISILDIHASNAPTAEDRQHFTN